MTSVNVNVECLFIMLKKFVGGKWLTKMTHKCRLIFKLFSLPLLASFRCAVCTDSVQVDHDFNEALNTNGFRAFYYSAGVTECPPEMRLCKLVDVYGGEIAN